MKTRILLPAALASLLLLGGCGGHTNVKVQGTTTISKGQQLSDLQRALNEGAITQSEYDSIREKILKWPD